MNPNSILIALFFLVLFALIAMSGLFLSLLFRYRSKLMRSFNLVLLSIKLPQKKAPDGKGGYNLEKERIAVMEHLYTTFSSIKETSFEGMFFYGHPFMSFELANPIGDEEIGFYLAAPRKFLSVIEKQIYGIFPDASLTVINDDYTIFSHTGKTAGSAVFLKKHPLLPIRSYLNLESDPLSEISNSLSRLSREEGGSIQIIFRPATHKWGELARRVSAKMRGEGKNFDNALGEITGFKKDLEKILNLGSQPNNNRADLSLKSGSANEEIIKAIENKSQKAVFQANIRLMSFAEKQDRADDILSQLEGAFSQFNSPILNQFQIKRLDGRKLKKLIYDYIFRFFDKRYVSILSTEEMTSIFHFPTEGLSTPKIKALKAKFAPPPSVMSKEGIVLGINNYRDQETIVYFDKEDRRRHLHVVGQTGTGKTVLLKNLIRQDIENGEGVCFIDPHGNDVEDILGCVPPHRIDDVIYFDPADLERPMGLNMLEYDSARPGQKTFVVNEMVSIFDKLYDLKAVGGPIFEQYARNAMLLILEDPESGSTLLEVPKVLADANFRKYKLSKCSNAVVRDFWRKEAEKAGGEASLANLVPYVTSKMNMFLSNDIMRPIVCQQKSAIDFQKVLNEGKILLVNLSKGRLGDSNSHLLGLIFVGKLLGAAFARVDLPDAARRDFYLYIDEFQNVTTESIVTILSEARKYKLDLTIAHQFIGQLTENIRKAIFGNVGSMISFRVGVEDAQFLEKEFEPVFDANDLANIDNFNAYVRLMVHNQIQKPFNIQTLSHRETDKKMMEAIKQLSRLKYGRLREEVEGEIEKRSLMT